MTFWTTAEVDKPIGIKDPNATLDFPISFSAWLADMVTTYGSHTVSVTGGIVVESTSHLNGVISVLLSGGTVGEVATFTIHIVTADGRSDDRTFYLKIADR